MLAQLILGHSSQQRVSTIATILKLACSCDNCEQCLIINFGHLGVHHCSVLQVGDSVCTHVHACMYKLCQPFDPQLKTLNCSSQCQS